MSPQGGYLRVVGRLQGILLCIKAIYSEVRTTVSPIAASIVSTVFNVAP